MSITYADDIELEQFVEEYDHDGEVFVRGGRGSEHNTFHAFNDCSNTPSKAVPKSPDVLFNDMILCDFCRFRVEGHPEEATA